MKTDTLSTLLASIRDCTFCQNSVPPLPVTPRPIICANPSSKIRIIGQAPGTRVHKSGIPFDDPSGDRLRDWLGVTKAGFYNTDNFAITPMGFCFPGLDSKGSDLPPRKECAPLWQDQVTAALPNIKLTLLVGMYAQKKYLGPSAHRTLTDTVKHWKDYGPDIIPLPHPSWRNTGWIKRHEWFPDVLEHLKIRVKDLLA